MEPRRRFKFIRELAQGGFGKVYLAEMITGDNFSTVVAIKLLHGRWLGNDEIVMRSRDEARLLGKLRHRNIVRVEDLSSINGQCAIVMEYLQGVDLKAVGTWLKEKGKIFPRKALFECLGGMATALEAAFSTVPIGASQPLAVIHRDIKPSNAMITLEGDIKVLDFGTARATFEEREAKTQVLAFGSQAYMSPERMLGEPDTQAADIFALGITLYEMLTLEPYGKIHLREERFEPTMCERVDAIDLDTLGLDVQADVRDALKQMLAYDPTRRPSAARVMELMEELSDRAGDAGLKRFAREVVREIVEANKPPIDPTDPCVGQLLYEDVSAVVDKASTTDVLPPPGQEPSPDDDEEPAIDLPGSKPNYGVEAPGAFAAPPPPRVSTLTPGVAGREITGSTPRPLPSTTSAPRARGPSPAADVTSGTLVMGGNEQPRSGGGIFKVVAALGLVFVLLVVGAGAAWYFVLRPKPVEMPTLPTTPVPGAGQKSGSAELDWSANASGKGGVILQVPEGATEVLITQTGGFRTEWDGSFNLRLKDLDPGTYRTKVRAKGSGAAPLSDFAVEADKTCLMVYTRGMWEKGECR